MTYARVVMALVTYILLAALHSGLQSRFHPEILGVTASTAIVVVLLDFAFVKFGCYILNIQVRSLVTLEYLLAHPAMSSGLKSNVGLVGV